MKFKTRLKPTQALIDLTPLVDVVFLLLIFFIITSDILPLKSLQIKNPSLETESLPLLTELLVVMDAHHVIYVGSKKKIVDLGSLKESLQKEMTRLKEHHKSIDPAIVLSIDSSVSYGLFLKVFAIAQQCSSRLRLVYQLSKESEESTDKTRFH